MGSRLSIFSEVSDSCVEDISTLFHLGMINLYSRFTSLSVRAIWGHNFLACLACCVGKNVNPDKIWTLCDMWRQLRYEQAPIAFASQEICQKKENDHASSLSLSPMENKNLESFKIRTN